MIKKLKNKKKEKGFTLIEMLISISLFTVVVTIAFGALITIISASSKAKTLKIVVNNLNLAMESMTREIRTGSFYNCNSSATSPGDGSGNDEDCILPSAANSNVLYLKSDDDEEVVYYLDDGQIKVEKTKNGATTKNTLTGDDVNIEYLKFAVVGAEKGDSVQPRVFIVLQGHITKGDADSRFNIQSTVSQRKIEP
ncbi:hypothetical protein CSB11_00080 [Candidatus Campbellbacteria bacterium]|nr:MAG: hypothetical protein CSB11_00080 [Candidatus Campbellbacteria bacterium]